MAHSKIDIFFQLSGLDCHIELTPGEGESGIALLQSAVAALVRSGAEPRPVPGRSGPRSGSQPVPDKCPECGGAVKAADWTNKEGKKFKIYECGQNKQHFKPIFKLAS